VGWFWLNVWGMWVQWFSLDWVHCNGKKMRILLAENWLKYIHIQIHGSCVELVIVMY